MSWHSNGQIRQNAFYLSGPPNSMPAAYWIKNSSDGEIDCRPNGALASTVTKAL
jgi:hypothetical protein